MDPSTAITIGQRYSYSRILCYANLHKCIEIYKQTVFEFDHFLFITATFHSYCHDLQQSCRNGFTRANNKTHRNHKYDYLGETEISVIYM